VAGVILVRLLAGIGRSCVAGCGIIQGWIYSRLEQRVWSDEAAHESEEQDLPPGQRRIVLVGAVMVASD